MSGPPSGRPSLLAAGALVAVNAVPLVGVLAWGWQLRDVMILYWLENVTIGLVAVVKVGVVAKWAGLAAIPFFVVHFGLFSFVHLLFLLATLSFGSGQPLQPASAVAAYLSDGWVAVACFGVSHLVSLLFNFIGRREYRRLSLSAVMLEPYRRVALMHMTLLATAVAVVAIGSPLPGLVALVLIKLSLDLRAHRRERAAPGQLVWPR